MAKEQCECGAMVSPQGKAMHLKGKDHLAFVASQGGTETGTEAATTVVDATLHPDLQAAIDEAAIGEKRNLQAAARMVRSHLSATYGEREKWPYSPLDFLNQHGIPLA